MGPKPIQDIAPPRAINSSAEPPSGPEIVDDIPVRVPSQQATTAEGPVESKNNDSSFIISNNQPEAKKPDAPVLVADKKDKIKPKNAKPKPTLAIVIALLATICLAAGVYLKFLSNS